MGRENNKWKTSTVCLYHKEEGEKPAHVDMVIETQPLHNRETSFQIKIYDALFGNKQIS